MSIVLHLDEGKTLFVMFWTLHPISILAKICTAKIQFNLNKDGHQLDLIPIVFPTYKYTAISVRK